MAVDLASIVEAVALLDQIDDYWAHEWTQSTGESIDYYWFYQDDGKQRPAAAMHALAVKLIEQFDGIDEEDTSTLAESLRDLFDGAPFLSNLKSREVVTNDR